MVVHHIDQDRNAVFMAGLYKAFQAIGAAKEDSMA